MNGQGYSGIPVPGAQQTGGQPKAPATPAQQNQQDDAIRQRVLNAGNTLLGAMLGQIANPNMPPLEHSQYYARVAAQPPPQYQYVTPAQTQRFIEATSHTVLPGLTYGRTQYEAGRYLTNVAQSLMDPNAAMLADRSRRRQLEALHRQRVGSYVRAGVPLPIAERMAQDVLASDISAQGLGYRPAIWQMSPEQQAGAAQALQMMQQGAGMWGQSGLSAGQIDLQRQAQGYNMAGQMLGTGVQQQALANQLQLGREQLGLARDQGREQLASQLQQQRMQQLGDIVKSFTQGAMVGDVSRMQTAAQMLMALAPLLQQASQ